MYFLKFLKYQYIFILACVFFTLKAFSAGLTAQLSHNKIIDGDYFQLTLSSDKPISEPNLTELQKTFNTHGTSSGRSVTIINGQMNQIHSLSINLSPKKQGKLTIPPLIIGNEKTQALSIEVLDPTNLPKSKYEEGVNLLVTTNKKKYFELEDIPIYVKLISNKPIYNGQLIIPTSDNYEISLEKQGELKQEVINSQVFWVVENQYKLQAKQSGNIVLKPFRFDAVVEGDKLKYNNPSAQFNNNFSFSVNFNSVAREAIKIFSEPLSIFINTKPKDIKGWFLPAEKVTLTDDFGQTSLSFKQGEQITRKVNLTAYGARAEQLPEISVNDVLGAKIYIDSNQTGDYQINAKRAAVREMLLTIIPNKSGEINLPEIKVKWFNIKTNQPETAVLASRNINILTNHLPVDKPINNTENSTPSSQIKTDSTEKNIKEMNDKKQINNNSLKSEFKKDSNLFSKTSKKTYFWIIAILILLIAVLAALSQSKLKKRRNDKGISGDYQKNSTGKLSNSRFNNKLMKVRHNRPKQVNDMEDSSYFKQLKERIYKAIKNKDSTKLYQTLLLLKKHAPVLNHDRTFIHVQQELELSKYQSAESKNVDFNYIEQQMKMVLKSVEDFNKKPPHKGLVDLHPYQ